MLGFIFADTGVRIFSNKIENWPSALLSGYCKENTGKYDVKLSELISEEIFGISTLRAKEITSIKTAAEADEQTQKQEFDDNKTNDTGNEETNKFEEGQDPDTIDRGETNINKEEENRYPIIKLNLSGDNDDKDYFVNETTYTPNISKLVKDKSMIPETYTQTSKDLPLVLIIHTHGTEAYAEEGKDYYIDDGGEISRSHDTEKNVIAVGRVMADILNSKGIPTVHCETMHDKESYQDSYIRSAESIKYYLAKYPSIKYVFDIHRDAILKTDGSLVKAAVDIEGESTAQVMAVVGSNYKGANYPDWEKRFALAAVLKEKLDEKYEDFSRPIYLRGAAYNQQYCTGSLLIEVGTAGNTLSEAKLAAKHLSHALAEIIKGE